MMDNDDDDDDDDDDECGAVDETIGRGNRNTLRKPTPVPLGPPEIPHELTRGRTRAQPQLRLCPPTKGFDTFNSWFPCAYL
jgi:hypothetical protein